MTNSGDAAEQVVRLSLEGTEVALRLTGSAAKNIAAALYTIYKDRDTRKIKGQQKLTSMLKSGKELKVFTITDKNLKTFAKEANRYGVVYSALKGKENDSDHMVDILARAEDASKINRIVERFNLSAVDSASIKEEIIRDKTEKANIQKDDEDIIVDEMLSKPIQKDEPEINPFGAEMENGSPSEPSLTQPKKEEKHSNTKSFFEKKTSVREKLREIIENRKQKKVEPEKSKEPEEIKKKPETKEIHHEQPKHRKKKKQKAR